MWTTVSWSAAKHEHRNSTPDSKSNTETMYMGHYQKRWSRVLHQNYSQCGSELPPDWPVHQYHFETSFSFHARTWRNTAHKNYTEVAKQIFTVSEYSMCLDECCMTIRQQKWNPFVFGDLASLHRHEAVRAFYPSATVYSSSKVKVVW